MVSNWDNQNNDSDNNIRLLMKTLQAEQMLQQEMFLYDTYTLKCIEIAITQCFINKTGCMIADASYEDQEVPNLLRYIRSILTMKNILDKMRQ